MQSFSVIQGKFVLQSTANFYVTILQFDLWYITAFVAEKFRIYILVKIFSEG